MIDNKEIFVEDKEETKAEEANTYASSLGMFGSETNSPVSIGGYVENEEQSKEFLDAIAGTFLTILISVFLAPFIILAIIIAIAAPIQFIENQKYKKLLEKLDERQKGIVNKMVLDIRNYLVWKESIKYKETFLEIIKYLKRVEKKHNFFITIDEKQMKVDPKTLSNKYKQNITKTDKFVKNIAKTIIANNLTEMQHVLSDDFIGYDIITINFRDSSIEWEKIAGIVKELRSDIIIILNNINKKHKIFKGELLMFNHEFNDYEDDIEKNPVIMYDNYNYSVCRLNLQTMEEVCLIEPLEDK